MHDVIQEVMLTTLAWIVGLSIASVVVEELRHTWNRKRNK